MRQFYQFGIERIGGGGNSPKYDAGAIIEGDYEIIDIAVRSLRKVFANVKGVQPKVKLSYHKY